MSTVNILKRDFENAANIIPNWRDLSKQKIAEGYVENKANERMKEAYFAAFCLRYWYRIKKLYDDSSFLVNKLHLTYDDILDWYLDSITKVLSKEKFMDKSIFTYVKDGNVDKFINGCVYDTLEKTKDTYYQYYNYDRRKANLIADSYDAMVEEKGEWLSSPKSKLPIIDNLIKTLVSEKLYFEAVLVYFIAYNDVVVEKESSKGKKYFVFSKIAFSTKLRAFTNDDWENFIRDYGLDEDTIYDLQKYQYYSHRWLLLLINNGLATLKKRSEIEDICF